jgi:very-short-patch-repair endonuclease
MTQLFRGVYTVVGNGGDLYVRGQAALRLSPKGSALCAVTALRGYGVALPESMLQDPRTHVWISRGRGPRRVGIATHRDLPRTKPVKWRGLRCVPAEDCWLQLAAECSVDDLVLVADSLLRRQQPISNLATLARAVLAAGRIPGLARARRALALVKPGTDSPRETQTRLLLVKAGLPCPMVNLQVRVSGRTFYLDMAYEDRMLAIEYDGAGHVSDRQQMQRDQLRRRLLEDAGWRVITVTAADLREDPVGVVASVRAAYAGRLRQGTPAQLQPAA